MQKRIVIYLLAGALMLSACQSATSPQVVETQIATPSATAIQKMTAIQEATATLAVTEEKGGEKPTGQSVTTGNTANCTVVSQSPTPGATEQSIFPPVSDSDWTIGPDTAAVTIIEYGDFQ